MPVISFIDGTDFSGRRMYESDLYIVLTHNLWSPYLTSVHFASVGDLKQPDRRERKHPRLNGTRAAGKRVEAPRRKTMIRKAVFHVAVALGVLALCSMFAVGASAAPVSQHVTMTGYVSCTTCLLPNTCKNQTRLSCVQQWMGQGASYVLVVGNSHYVLSGYETTLAKAAGDTITVS
jgi:hypothetical protein